MSEYFVWKLFVIVWTTDFELFATEIRITITSYLSVLDFLKSIFHEIDFWTWFLSISNLMFTACVACKNEVPKMKFKNQVQKSISWNTDFKKSSTDR